jgi:hypothetical protein
LRQQKLYPSEEPHRPFRQTLLLGQRPHLRTRFRI